MGSFHVEKSSVQIELKRIDFVHIQFFQCLCFCSMQKGAKNTGLENFLFNIDVNVRVIPDFLKVVASSSSNSNTSSDLY